MRLLPSYDYRMATPYWDTFIFNAGQGRPASMLYMVQGNPVSEFSLQDSLEDKYMPSKR